VQSRPRKPQFPSRPEGNTANITSAVGIEETVGRLRARRHSLFTQTVMWVTGLICTAFLLGSLAQAWSNSQLMQQMQSAQQHLQQLQSQHAQLSQLANRYKDPAVIESEARQQLGYIRPGENPVIIMSSGNQGQQSIRQNVQAPAQQNYWQEWWSTFFGD
jgi:cell division protein FtsB